jgi:hypothetical protein
MQMSLESLKLSIDRGYVQRNAMLDARTEKLQSTLKCGARGEQSMGGPKNVYDLMHMLLVLSLRVRMELLKIYIAMSPNRALDAKPPRLCSF